GAQCPNLVRFSVFPEAKDLEQTNKICPVWLYVVQSADIRRVSGANRGFGPQQKGDGRPRIALGHGWHRRRRLPTFVKELLSGMYALVVKMEAPDGMLVSADLDKECPRHDLLKHGETKHIMGQAPKCIVGSHVSEHMQSAASNHELQRARARSVSVF